MTRKNNPSRPGCCAYLWHFHVYICMFVILSPYRYEPRRVWHFNVFLLEPSILCPQQGDIKTRHLLKYWAGDRSILVRCDITFMTPTPEILRSHFFHLLWAEFLKPFLFEPTSFRGRCPWKIGISARVPLATFWWRRRRRRQWWWNGKNAGGGGVVVVVVVVCCWWCGQRAGLDLR